MRALVFAAFTGLIAIVDVVILRSYAVDIDSAISFALIGVGNVIALWLGWQVAGVAEDLFGGDDAL